MDEKEETLKESVVQHLLSNEVIVHGYTQYINILKNRVEGLIEYSYPRDPSCVVSLAVK